MEPLHKISRDRVFYAFPYCRMSDATQIASIPAQRNMLTQYMAWKFSEFPNAKVLDFIEDNSVSATIPLRDRKGGGYIDRNARAGDHVLLALGDRAFRSIADCCVTIRDWTQREIVLHYCNTGLCTDTPTGRMIAHVLASLGEFELENKHQRVIEANAARRKNGMPVGSSAAWGWKIVGRRPKRRYVEDPVIRNLCNIASGLRDAGHSYENIASVLQEQYGPYKRPHQHAKLKWTWFTARLAVHAARDGFPGPEPIKRSARKKYKRGQV